LVEGTGKLKLSLEKKKKRRNNREEQKFGKGGGCHCEGKIRGREA